MPNDLSAVLRGQRLQGLLRELLAEDLVVRVPFQLHLPNLRPRPTDFAYAGEELRLTAEVENVGRARSRPCEVQATLWLSAQNRTEVLAAGCAALDPGTSRRVPLGSVQDVAGNQFADVTVVVDPPTAARPGGQVWESDETDNVRFDGVYLAPAPLEPLPEEFPEKPEEPTPPEPPI